MTAVKSRQDTGRYWATFVPATLLAALAFFFGAACFGVVQAASPHPLAPADAIIVFGAAQYAGRPSPVFRARLDHAFDLYRRGLAPIVIPTGGSGADPSFSEGGVGHDYLRRRGIPEDSLIAETQGSDTAQSAQRVAVIMRTNHMRRAIAVSDAYHLFRIQKLLEHEGVQVTGSPRPDSVPHDWRQRAQAVVREALSFIAWRLDLT
jgi:uncharacterized SAM-binding protein YcdF (DUF218 family)